MGIVDRLKGMLRRKQEEQSLTETPPVGIPSIIPEITPETATIENVRAKMDLILTQMDSLRTQYVAMNERIIQIEKMLRELYDLAKSS